MNLKKTLSSILAGIMVLSCNFVLPVSAEGTGPVAQITFDSDSDATYPLMEGAALADGRSGKALSLDGSGQYAEVGGVGEALSKITGDFSISVWCNPSTVTTWGRVYDFGNGSGGAYAFLTASAGSAARFAVTDGSGEQKVDASTVLDTGTWQNVVISRSGSNTSFYLNGKIVGTSSSIDYKFSELGTLKNYYLGKSQYDDPYFSGMIDDLLIYDRALSQEEVITLAAEAYVNEDADNINKYNCQILQTAYQHNGETIFAVGKSETGKLKSSTQVKNYTLEEVTLTAQIYGTFAEGTTVEFQNTSSKTFGPGEEGTVDVEIDLPLPDGLQTVRTSIVSSADGKTYYTTELPVTDTPLVMPVKAPADSDRTTYGAHDPSIVKYDNDDTYYVYSSHHLIFTSTDLVNWEKHDFTNKAVKDISPVTYNFITKNYTGTTVNGTYWAPDVIYREDDTAHPYWMYISVSCGLGGRNSAISLMKSSSPLFWADPEADIVDAGVVFATKENSSYITNAIDANIYTQEDGTQYFIWGSFWGGIQAAKMSSDGFVEAVNYSSDAAVLSSCAAIKNTVYSQKGGKAGPEGAWMFENNGYRYMFTSYGWLGSNYNTRVARSSVSAEFADTTLVDQNGVTMDNQYDKGSNASPSGYKMIGSFRLGDGSMDIALKDDNYYVARSGSDAHIYYGPGHNSAVKSPEGEDFYISHTRKDAVEGAAYLQARKMLWTEDGWPVVNPVVYAGEKEQALPESLIPGTYDLASVGHTKMQGTSVAARNFDLPVLSSKVTLNDDGTLADGLGTWTFDGNYTVTLTFAKDGDESKDEFYKNGDVMTLYALLSYDKDEQEYTMALTGVDQKHVTQFARKSMDVVTYTDAATVTSEPVTIAKSTGGNPELGFDGNGELMYGGDPAALVDGDTVYLYVGHDTAKGESYEIPEWACYSSKNMTDWTYEGIVMSASSISWASNKTSAWASQVTKYNNKYYLYYCTWDKTSDGKQSIGVAVSDSPTGPFTDIGKPLVQGSFTMPESASHDDIDPTVLITTDEEGVEHRYLAWGNTRFYICELNEDMTSIKDIDGDGEIIMHKDVLERKIKSMGSNTYTEAPWLYERDGKYYLFYAMNWREEMAYAMADDPMGRWDFKQRIMPPSATSNTNHPAVIDFNGKTYFIYHNGALSKGSGYRRSVCIQELEFDEEGYVYPLTELSIGLGGAARTILTNDKKYLGHDEFTNTRLDSAYPLSVGIKAKNGEDGYNTAWEIVPAKNVPSGQNAEHYVSVQSVNKPGLYISAKDDAVTLTQDADGNQGTYMTFKTVRGVNGDQNAVSFESAAAPGKYLAVLNGKLMLSYAADKNAASFTLGGVSEVAKNQIQVAAVEPDPEPAEEISNNFDDAAVTRIMNIGLADQPVNTDYAGVGLYIGTRANGADTTSNWSIETGGRSGNALVMNSGKYVSVNRGPRMQITSPAVPDGYTMTGSMSVKLGSSASKLYYNDSTSTQTDPKNNLLDTNTDITGNLSTSGWSEVKITVANNAETYTRKITVNGTEIASDYVSSFPVFWGTTANDTSAKVYFDDVHTKTERTDGNEPVTDPMLAEISGAYAENGTVGFTLHNAKQYKNIAIYIAEYTLDGALAGVKADTVKVTSNEQEVALDYAKKSQENTLKVFAWYDTMLPAASADVVMLDSKPTPTPVAVPEPDVKYTFDGDISMLVSVNATGGSDGAPAVIATEAGKSGRDGDLALSFSGAGSGGVMLDQVPASKQYTVSFDVKLNASTQYSPFLLMMDYNDGAALAGDTDAKWISIAPQGWQSTLSSGPMIWSRDVAGGNAWNDIYTADNNAMKLDTWQNITVTADGTAGAIFVDGKQVASGNITDIIDGSTKIFVGVNFWDTPLNGAIDNLVMYNRVLTNDEIQLIVNN